MRPLRRFAAAVGLGVGRARQGGMRTALVVLGVAGATGLLAAVLVSSKSAERDVLDRSIAELSPAGRTVRAVWFGVPAQAEPYGSLDQAARASLEPIAPNRATGTVLFRESTIGGAFVALGAVDQLSRWVRLTRGRLPRGCAASRCEVLQLRGSGRTPRGFVVVGRARLRTTALFGDGIPAERSEVGRLQLAPSLQRIDRYHQPAPPPLLLANGVRELSSLPSLLSSYRSYGWVVELGSGYPDPWRVDEVVAEAGRARASLQARSVGFDLTAPIEELRAGRDRARVGARRLLLLGGQAAVLVLAFAAFAATRLQRTSQAADRRLALLGVALWARTTVVAAHAAVLAVVGVVGAWSAGTVAVALADPDLARHALLSTEALVAAGTVAVVAMLAVGLVLTTSRPASGGFGWLDAVGVSLVVALGAALTRGAADAEELLREDGSGVFLLALPAGVVMIAAIATARVFPPLARALERRLPPRALAPRLAAISLARRPGAGRAAVAFLAVSVAVALFASAYGATLDRGQREQAAFALGADLVLREDLRRLVPVRKVATAARLAKLGAGVEAAGVTRASANVASVGNLSGITVLGLEASLLRSLRGTTPPARELEVPAALVGPRVPRSARTLELSGRSSVDVVSLVASIRQPNGEYSDIELEIPGRAAVPRAASGGTLIGFQFVPPPRLVERGADSGRPFVAEVELGPLTAAGKTVISDYSRWVGLGGASFREGILSLTLSNQVDTWFRPRQALDAIPLPAIVSPALASIADEDRRLTLQVGGHPLRVAVAAVGQTFPSTRGDFAVVDRPALESALNLAAPGSGFVTEVWANAATPEAEASARRLLRTPPFDALVLDSRVEREDRLRDDPLARGALRMLAVGAILALLLALVALALTTLSDLRDDRQELLDLESQGAPPALLRRLVRLRQLGVGLVGLVGGLVAGAVLTALVVDVVSVSAAGEPPVPPLTLSFDPAPALAVLAGAGAAAVVFVAVATHGAFRRGDAGRPVEGET